MKYYWRNMFNGCEEGGPYKTAKEAMEAAVQAMVFLQDGFAFNIEIIHHAENVVKQGHIKKGKWINGPYKAKKGEPGFGKFWG